MKKHSRLHSLLREPLLHFLVIGAALFFVFNQFNDTEVENRQRIIISQADLNKLATTWLRRTGRPPTAQEREQQLEHYIREQVLYREAMNMGLDKNDVIVRRRLSKKMEYLFNDLNFINDPTEAELNTYLSTNAGKFTTPARITFSQIYLAPEQHDKSVKEKARKIFEQLKTKTNAEANQLGDRSLLPNRFDKEKESEIAGMFGTEFAKQIFTLPINNWRGPITSGYGAHLVQVHSRSEKHLPPLAEIHAQVSREWHNMKQRKANEVFYQSLYQRYEIALDDSIAENMMAHEKK